MFVDHMVVERDEELDRFVLVDTAAIRSNVAS